MLRNVIKFTVVAGLVSALLVVGILYSPILPISHGQSEEIDSLADYFIELRDSNTQVYIEFISPIDEIPGWAVPEDFTNDADEIIARRIIGKIGEDFVCIDSIGQGFTVTYCIPFSNIAFITQPAP